MQWDQYSRNISTFLMNEYIRLWFACYVQPWVNKLDNVWLGMLPWEFFRDKHLATKPTLDQFLTCVNLHMLIQVWCCRKGEFTLTAFKRFLVCRYCFQTLQVWNYFNVLFQLLWWFKPHFTQGALKWSLFTVYNLVFLQFKFWLKGFFTQATTKRPFVTVYPLVGLELL